MMRRRTQLVVGLALALACSAGSANTGTRTSVFAEVERSQDATGPGVFDGVPLSVDTLESLVSQGMTEGMDGPKAQISLVPRALVHWVLLRNPEVLIADEQAQAARWQIEADQAAFQPEVFMTIERSERDRRNSLERPDQPVLKDDETLAEAGVRTLLGTGAELTLSYESRDRFSNASSGDDPEGYKDVIGNLRVELRQPLLQGRGATDVKARIAQSRHESEIAQQELRQGLLVNSYEAMRLYWQLYRAQQLHAIALESLNNARQLYDDSRRLRDAGRVPRLAVVDARSGVLEREAELVTAAQALTEARGELRSLLNLDASVAPGLQFVSLEGPDLRPSASPADFGAYLEEVLRIWPNYLVANARIAVNEQALRVARDQRQSQLDLVLSYGQNSRSFDSSVSDAFRDAWRDDYPQWTVGLELSMPLGQNRKGRAEEAIAQSQLQQAQLEAAAVRSQVSNQLMTRIEQVQSTFEEVSRLNEKVSLLSQLLAGERDAFGRGESSARRVIEREDDLNLARLRAIDAAVRFELAKLALSLSDGSLLDALGVEFEPESI